MTTQTAPAPIFDDVTTATPVQIDEHLSHLSAKAAQLGNRLYDLRNAKALALRNEPLPRVFHGMTAVELAGRIAAAEIKQAQVAFLMYPLEAEFDRRPWSRYYLVDGGHLHFDVSGDRCNRDRRTRHYWMTEFSGWDSDKVINGDGDKHQGAGERVCTKCFPDAPVAPRPASARFMTMTEAERAAYAEAKERKAVAKKAAEITNVEGGELIVDGRRVKTERAAWNLAMQEATSLAWYGDSHPSAIEWREAIRLCLAALAHRRKVDVHDLYADLNAKVAKKVAKDGGTVLSVA